MMKHFAAVLLAGMGLGGAGAQGSLVFQENFDYGSSNFDNGYGAWSDTTNNVQYNTLNLALANPNYTAGDNTASTGSIQFSGSGTPRGAQVQIDPAGLTGQFWMSYLIRTNADALGEYVITALHSTATYSNASPVGDSFGVGWDGSARRVVFRDQSANTVVFSTGLSLASNEVGLLIAKVTINASADDSVSLWLMNASSSFGLTEASLGTPALTVNTADWGDSVSQLWAGKFSTSITGNLDAIRISDAAGDAGLAEVIAVPEPGVLALGTLAGLAVLRRRR